MWQLTTTPCLQLRPKSQAIGLPWRWKQNWTPAQIVKVRFMPKNKHHVYLSSDSSSQNHQPNKVAHLVFKSHHLLTGVEGTVQSSGYPCRGYFTTPLSIFPLYSDIKKLNTFCRHRNGWRWLYFWQFFLCPDFLRQDSHFHTFAKHTTRALPKCGRTTRALPKVYPPAIKSLVTRKWEMFARKCESKCLPPAGRGGTTGGASEEWCQVHTSGHDTAHGQLLLARRDASLPLSLLPQSFGVVQWTSLWTYHFLILQRWTKFSMFTVI